MCAKQAKYGKKGGCKFTSRVGDICEVLKLIWCDLTKFWVCITVSLSCQDKRSILILISKFDMERLCWVCILKTSFHLKQLASRNKVLSNFNRRCLYLGGENTWDSPLILGRVPLRPLIEVTLFWMIPFPVCARCRLASKHLFARRIVERCLLHFRFATLAWLQCSQDSPRYDTQDFPWLKLAFWNHLQNISKIVSIFQRV